jgi:hypothetical protein
MTEGVKALFAEMTPGLPDSLIFTGKKGDRLASVSNTFDRAVSELGFNKGLSDPGTRSRFTASGIHTQAGLWTAASTCISSRKSWGTPISR